MATSSGHVISAIWQKGNTFFLQVKASTHQAWIPKILVCKETNSRAIWHSFLHSAFFFVTRWRWKSWILSTYHQGKRPQKIFFESRDSFTKGLKGDRMNILSITLEADHSDCSYCLRSQLATFQGSLMVSGVKIGCVSPLCRKWSLKMFFHWEKHLVPIFVL